MTLVVEDWANKEKTSHINYVHKFLQYKKPMLLNVVITVFQATFQALLMFIANQMMTTWKLFCIAWIDEQLWM